MKGIYNLNQHTNCIYIHMGRGMVSIDTSLTANKTTDVKLKTRCALPYNIDIISEDNSYFHNPKRKVETGSMMDILYDKIEKGANCWDQISENLGTEIFAFFKRLIESKIDNRDLDKFHYAIAIPEEWNKNVRENLIRPILIKTGFVSSDDHKDRVLFFSDIECGVYSVNEFVAFKRRQNTLLCRILPETPGTPDNAVIKLSLIETTNTLSDFPDSMLRPYVKQSRSLSITSDYIKKSLQTFLKNKLRDGNIRTFNDGDIRMMAEEIFKYVSDKMGEKLEKKKNERNSGDNIFSVPLVVDASRLNLSESQTKFVGSLYAFEICDKIGKTLLDVMEGILSYGVRKEYELLIFLGRYSLYPRVDLSLGIWIVNILYCNYYSLNNTHTINTIIRCYGFEDVTNIISGAQSAMIEIVRNSDIYCNPAIIPNKNLSTSSSIFVNSKPDGIISIDISLKSTLISYSVLNEDGTIKEILDHDHFDDSQSLLQLNECYEFLNGTNLNIKEQFFSTLDKSLRKNLNYFSQFKHDPAKASIIFDIEDILSCDSSTKNIPVSNLRKKYNSLLLLIYMNFITETISSRLPTRSQYTDSNIKIGYAVSIEKMLLDNSVDSKEEFQELIYMSGLVQEKDDSTKLRVTTLGEGLLPIIQKCFETEFPVKSYFVLAQLHEDYIQLSMNQVVVPPNQDDEQQESIILEEKIISTPNIYDSFCLNMWNNILQNSSLLQFCDKHSIYHDGIFSLEAKNVFFANLKEYIIDNILAEDSNISNIEKDAIQWSDSCDCHVSVTADDVIEISFKPILQDIAIIVSTSLINKEFFGNYQNVKYIFSLLHFNLNSQLQEMLSVIMEDDAKISTGIKE